jgi:hypothetical protein
VQCADELEARVRANCCPYHGLTPGQFEKHIAGILRMINQARNGQRLPRQRKRNA